MSQNRFQNDTRDKSPLGFYAQALQCLRQAAGLSVALTSAGELRALERGGSGPLPPAGPTSPGVNPASHAPEVPSTATSAQATKGSTDARNTELFCMEDAEATVETLLLMEYADLGTLDQTVTSGKLKGDLVRALT